MPSGTLADVLTEKSKHTAPDAAADQFFGRAVAIRDDLVVVGADGDRQRRGAAYVYRVDDGGWTELAKLMDPTAVPGDGLGESVCFPRSGEVAASVWADDLGTQYGIGTVQLYSQAAGWARSALLSPHPAAADPGGFGRGLACAEGRLLVGAAYSDGTFAHEGLATFFRHDGTAWRYDGWFEPVEPRYQGYLGSSVAIDGDLAAAAAPGRPPRHLTFYRRTAAGWAVEADVPNAPGVTAMVLSGELLVVGAAIDDGLRADSGVVIVHRRIAGEWVEQTRLLPEQAEPYNRFGDRLAFDGELLAIGESFGDVAGPNHGAVHLFFRDGDEWRRGDVLAASDGFPSQGFGRSLAIGEERILVGAVLDDERAYRAGAIYEYDRPDAVLEIEIDPWPSRPGIGTRLQVPLLPIALLGSADFDPTHVDRDSLAFGPLGAPALASWTLRDVDHDGDVDGVGWFSTADGGIAPGDTEVCLTGETHDGTAFEGCAEVLVVASGCGQGVDLAVALPLMVALGRGAMRRRRRRPEPATS